MATSKDTSTESEAPAEPKPEVKGKVENEGAGEHWGKPVGRDIDTSFHAEVFTDPNTGEPLEVTQTVHDVPVGTNADGTVKTAKATDGYAKAKE